MNKKESECKSSNGDVTRIPKKNKKKESEETKEEKEKNTMVYGVEMKEILSRHVVGETLDPIDIDEILEKLRRDWHMIEDLKLMGSYKILVTFLNIEEMEIAFKFDYLLNHFNEAHKWSTQEYNHS